MEAIGIVAALFTVVGAVFATQGYRGIQKTRRFVAASASAKGTVTDSVGRWYRDPGDDPGVSKLSHPVVRFVTGDGRTVEFESQTGSNLAPKVGLQVPVLYDRLDPKEEDQVLHDAPGAASDLRGARRVPAHPRAADAGGPSPAPRAVRRAMPVLAICAALLVGCEGGTLSNYSQNCTSTGGFLEGRTVACSGEAQSLSGSVGLEFGEGEDEEEELSGTYRLTAEISVQSGEARVYSYYADGERLPLGSVSEGSPLRLDGVTIEPFNESSVFFVDAGEEGEVEGLRYEARIEPV